MEEFLLTNPELETSNNHLTKIKDLADPNSNIEVSFEIVSKDPGIAFISFDPTESLIQLFHHWHIIGGSWASPSKSLISILGVDDLARPIQIITKSVKVVKTKTNSFLEITDDETSIKNLVELKSTRL